MQEVVNVGDVQLSAHGLARRFHPAARLLPLPGSSCRQVQATDDALPGGTRRPDNKGVVQFVQDQIADRMPWSPLSARRRRRHRQRPAYRAAAPRLLGDFGVLRGQQRNPFGLHGRARAHRGAKACSAGMRALDGHKK
jgi:hypothetical protein